MIEEEIINDVVYNLKRLTSLENIDFKTVEQSRRYDYDLTYPKKCKSIAFML